MDGVNWNESRKYNAPSGAWPISVVQSASHTRAKNDQIAVRTYVIFSLPANGPAQQWTRLLEFFVFVRNGASSGHRVAG